MLLLLLCHLVCLSPALGSLGRHSEPLVLTGEQLGLGEQSPVVPEHAVGFRLEAGEWVQIPVQVDERHHVDWDTVKQEDCRLHLRNLTSLVYSDPDTFVGPDPDTSFDSDDEIVFMLRDAGIEQYSGGAIPEGTVHQSIREVVLLDPLDDNPDTPVGYVYLFTAHKDSPLEPSAGERRIQYNFTLTKTGQNGEHDYKSVYVFNNNQNQGGGNPEDSSVETLYYTRHWMENWLSDGLRIGGGEDIFLLQDFQFSPSSCGRHVDTFRKSQTAFIANKSGTLRGIRSWVGANSGSLTQRTSLMYEGREDLVTNLRVHPVHGVMDYVLLQPGVEGVTWYNGANPGGVTVDGNMDDVDTTFSPWQLLSTPSGGYLRSYSLEQDLFPGADMADVANTFYVDNREPVATEEGVAVHPGDWHMCCSPYIGTSEAWGVSGFTLQSWVSGLPNTCPNRALPKWSEPVPEGACKDGSEESSVSQLTLTMTQLYLGPGEGGGHGEERQMQLEQPVLALVTPWDYQI